jgi:UPF0755 protein
MSEFEPGRDDVDPRLLGSDPSPDDSSDPHADDPYVEGGRRKKGRSVPGCLAVLIALLVVVGGGAFGVMKGVALLKDQLVSPGDYTGPGQGKVLFEVHEGDTAAAIGRALKDAGVVKSVQAFTDAAAAEPASRGIQVGTYQLQKELPAVEALAILIDPDNLIRNTVTIPEGLRIEQILDILGDKTDFSREKFAKILDKPNQLGLPAYADGQVEGYLFPSTYDVGPNDKPEDILRAMVDRWKVAAEEVDLEGNAARLGYTPAELMVVASLIQAEARGKYMPVSRVIYNRLETSGETFYLLQLDATVNYAHGENLGATTTDEQRAIDSPYNTYRYAGLPPGPISAPGEDAMRAAAEPDEGPWFYYVTVNLKTGETKFAVTLAEHNVNVEEFNEYCRTQSERC